MGGHTGHIIHGPSTQVDRQKISLYSFTLLERMGNG